MGLFLVPEVTGLRPGTELLSRVFANTRNLGCTEIALEPTITAHAFYTARGFRDTGPPLAVPVGPVQIEVIPMLRVRGLCD